MPQRLLLLISKVNLLNSYRSKPKPVLMPVAPISTTSNPHNRVSICVLLILGSWLPLPTTRLPMRSSPKPDCQIISIMAKIVRFWHGIISTDFSPNAIPPWCRATLRMMWHNFPTPMCVKSLTVRCFPAEN